MGWGSNHALESFLAGAKNAMNPLTTRQVVARIGAIVATLELLIMLLLQALLHEEYTYSEAAIDTVLLAALSIPAIYIWVIKPFVDARDGALAQIRHLALTDPLTQLANRRLLSEHLQRLIAGSIRHKDHAALLLIDLDGFKHVNDEHGHEAGDAVLVEIARRLRSATRSEDVVGRLGGDEFVILIDRLCGDERTARSRALRTAEKMIGMINKKISFKGKTLRVGASIGIRLLGFDEMDPEAALSQADAAMYRAKETGRGRAVFFEQ